MPPPPSVDKTVLERFGQLIRQTQDFYERNSNDAYPFKGAALAEFTQLTTHTTTLIYLLLTKDTALRDKLDREIKDLPVNSDGAAKLQGILKALQQDYKVRLLNLSTAIETSVVSDYMSLAEQLLGEGVKEQYDHIPAAVLAGAVLEDALRRLCERQNPAIPIMVNSKYKMLKTLIDDLKQSAVFNVSTAKELEAWTSIRNHAAHGEFDEVNRSGVERMIEGVKSFLADNL